MQRKILVFIHFNSKHDSVFKAFEDMKLLTVHELHVYEIIKFVCKSIIKLSTTPFPKFFVNSGQNCTRSSRLLSFTISSKRSTFLSFSLKRRGSKMLTFWVEMVCFKKFWLNERRRSNGFCSYVPWSLYAKKYRSCKMCFWKVNLWLSWWLMLVVDCCDDRPEAKATNRCLPGTVHGGGWHLADIIVVGCYAYTTQLKIVIFLKIDFFGHC